MYIIKKVKYIWENREIYGLTNGKIYDVVKYNYDSYNGGYDSVEIVSDHGGLCSYYLCNDDLIFFEDVTLVIERNEKIDEILE